MFAIESTKTNEGFLTMTAEKKKAVKRLVSNAWKLAATPALTLDDCDGKYYAGYVGDKIAIFEKNDGIPPRVIVYFPGTSDGKIAAERVCDSLNLPIAEISIDDTLSFEQTP